MKKHYETHVEDTDKLISVAGPVLDYKSWYEQYRKLMEEQAQRKYGLYTPTSEGDEDDFPSIPGMIARYSALGLTNEQMEQNPVWVDKTGNGHDLQMKNLAWGGMSGVGGYSDNFSSDSWKKPSDRSDITWTSSSFNITRVMNTGVQIYYFSAWEESESVIPEKRIIVKGLEDGQVLRYMNVGNRIIEISQDGIYTIPSFTFKGANSYHGYSLAKKQESCNVTVEQLPLYPGALVFDGVDDYGVCDNFPILTKEKGYTVVALRSIIDKNIPGYLLSNSAGSNQGAFIFERTIDSLTASFGKSSPITVNYNNPLTYQTTSKYNQKSISVGELLEGGKSLVVGRNSKEGNLYANAAIWELVFLDHDATEEELTKIKDYFVKTYPWLFPDQAWTVVGKTNEDEDRATIANITGNGNDLVLSNFGFAEGSGYGLYVTDFTKWVNSNADLVTKNKFVFAKSSTGSSYVIVLKGNPILNSFRIKVSGFTGGKDFVTYRYYEEGNLTTYKITTNGIHTLPASDGTDEIGFLSYNIVSEITIEQIPEYEGYLVTDGVDDKIISKEKFTTQQSFTLVGDWQFVVKEDKRSGVIIHGKLYCFNRSKGVWVYVNDSSHHNDLVDTTKIRALSSDGKLYDENWNEIQIKTGNVINVYEYIQIGGHTQKSEYTSVAFKNIAIYNQILSKDDCIKAYNYLQTLKAK